MVLLVSVLVECPFFVSFEIDCVVGNMVWLGVLNEVFTATPSAAVLEDGGQMIFI
jgi:hypothetical protein